MAIESVEITPGSGEPIAVDKVGGNGYQVVKLAIGADGTVQVLDTVDADTGAGTDPRLAAVILGAAAGGAQAIPGDATNGLKVDVARMAALVAGSALVGDVGLGVRTAGGLSVFRSIDVDETEEAVKASAGQVYGWFLSNRAAGERVVKFYNDTVANVVVGTTTPVLTIPLLQGQASNVWFGQGIPFSTAITIAAVTGIADSSTGAPGANEIVANVFYA